MANTISEQSQKANEHTGHSHTEVPAGCVTLGTALHLSPVSPSVFTEIPGNSQARSADQHLTQKASAQWSLGAPREPVNLRALSSQPRARPGPLRAAVGTARCVRPRPRPRPAPAGPGHALARRASGVAPLRETLAAGRKRS